MNDDAQSLKGINGPFPKPTRRLRWRIIPGTFLLIFFVLGTIGAPLEMMQVVDFNRQHGWVHQIDPLHPMAITSTRLLVWMSGVIAVAAAGVSAYAWFYGRWRTAWIGVIVFFGLIITAKWLEST
jgi:hypothetical protein